MKSLDLAQPGDEDLHAEGIWVTAEGIKTPVCLMSNKHICNVVKHLILKAKWEVETGVSELLALPIPRGEVAQDMYFNEIEMFACGAMGWEQIFDDYTIVPFLYAEAEKRGILKDVQNSL